MQVTGFVRKVDELGRLLIPMTLRKQYGIENSKVLYIQVNEEYIFIMPDNKKGGVAINCDSLGRIVIPATLRRIMDITPGTSMEYFIVDGGIMTRKYMSGCIFCGYHYDLKYLGAKGICPQCIDSIKNL